MNPGSPKKSSPLSAFLREMLKLGSLQGFKYFTTYLRGREELLLTVLDQKETVYESSASYAHLALSTRSMNNLNSATKPTVMPASPSENEMVYHENAITFLVAAYARYQAPYVWVRTNHERLLSKYIHNPAVTVETLRDRPLKLRSTLQWSNREVPLWEVVSEAIGVAYSVPPSNPFAIDYKVLEDMEPAYRILATSGLMEFLFKVYTEGSARYIAKVWEDLVELQKVHYAAIAEVADKGISYLENPVFQPMPQEARQAVYSQPAPTAASYGQQAPPPMGGYQQQAPPPMGAPSPMTAGGYGGQQRY
eukprot:Clim_evm21s152 gene=Clim_evmTU21s152